MSTTASGGSYSILLLSNVFSTRLQEFDLDILKWLQIENVVSDESYIKPLDFLVPETGGTVSSSSKGLLVEMQQGPVEFSIFNILTTSGSSSGNKLYFAGVLGRDNPVSQMASTYCSVSKVLLWPSGTLSEPTGMLSKDATCQFLLDGARDTVPPSSSVDYRGVEITVHEIGFESDEEFLSIEQQKIGFPKVEMIFRRGSATPVTLQMATTVTIGYVGKSGLGNRTLTWAQISDILRFKVSYKSLRIGIMGQDCAKSCSFSPECIRERWCFENATLLTINGDHIVQGDRTRSLQDSGTSNKEESAKQEIWVSSDREAGAEARRQSSPHVQRLTMTINGVSGLWKDVPSGFAQNTRQIATVVERRPDLWRGADGSWQGKCFVQPACAADTEQEECVSAAMYFLDDNLCQVRIEINDRIVREYRWNCRGQPSVEGSAHGVIVSIEPEVEREESQTGVTIMAYRRMQVTPPQPEFYVLVL